MLGKRENVFHILIANVTSIIFEILDFFFSKLWWWFLKQQKTAHFQNRFSFLKRYIADLHNSPTFLWLDKNITKTHAIDIHTVADDNFVINTCHL